MIVSLFETAICNSPFWMQGVLLDNTWIIVTLTKGQRHDTGKEEKDEENSRICGGNYYTSGDNFYVGNKNGTVQ